MLNVKYNYKIKLYILTFNGKIKKTYKEGKNFYDMFIKNSMKAFAKFA